MLDPPADTTAWTRWLVDLYWPLRARCKWGEPIPFDAIDGYLRMRGHDPAELFDWVTICDDAVLGWMNEETERRQENARRKAENARRSIRH